MRVELPTVSLCDGCGRCCEHIGMPPFEARNPDLGPDPAQRKARDKTNGWPVLADMETFDRMPAALRAEHAAAVSALDADPTGGPCAWLDPATKRCRHYEFRPVVCREFEPGEYRCAKLRAGRSQCVWQDDNSPPAWQNPRVKLTEDEVYRRDAGFWRWLWRRLRRDYSADRRSGWNVFESLLRRVWPGQTQFIPSRELSRVKRTWAKTDDGFQE